MVTAIDWCSHTTHDWYWLISYFGFNDPLRQYFSLYRAVSQRGRKKRKKIDERKMFKQPPTAPTASAIVHCPTIFQISGTPRHWKFTQHYRTTPLATGLRRLSLSLSLFETNKLFGFTLMSRKFNKTTLWHKLEIQNKLKRKVKERKVKEGEKGEKRHIVFSLLTELTWTSMQGAGHIVSTLKR